jgi:hypothetical protein
MRAREKGWQFGELLFALRPVIVAKTTRDSSFFPLQLHSFFSFFSPVVIIGFLMFKKKVFHLNA